MQGGNNLGAGLFLRLSLRISLVQETVEVAVVGENFGTNEVEEREEFLEVILEGGAGDEHSSTRAVGPDDLREEGVHVLDTVSLVDNDVAPRELGEGALFTDADLVRGDEDFEVVGEESAFDGLALAGERRNSVN